MININDLFFTLQGEGANWGRRSLFVRMPFCNMSCSWCDTKFDTFKAWSEDEFLAFAQTERCKFAVITGGEPTMNKHTPVVISLLKSIGYEIAIESNGTFEIPMDIDFVTVSPKREAGFQVHSDAFAKADEFKYVVDGEFDFNILKVHDVTDGRRYSLSPEFGDMKTSVDKIIAFIKENPAWRMSLQTHKWVQIP